MAKFPLSYKKTFGNIWEHKNGNVFGCNPIQKRITSGRGSLVVSTYFFAVFNNFNVIPYYNVLTPLSR